MRTVIDFPSYSVTKDGRVWSRITNKWLSLAIGSTGYPTVILYRGTCQEKKQFNIHELVLSTFVSSRPKGLECRHLNGNRQDSRLCNLRWGTRRENHEDALKHKTHQGLKNKGENHPQAKLCNKSVKNIRKMSQDGIPDYLIALAFGVSRTIINRVKNRKLWSWVN